MAILTSDNPMGKKSSPEENNKDIAERMGSKDHIISAGFVKFNSIGDKVKASCYGQSTSLGKFSHPMDSDWLTIYMDNF